HGRAPDGAADPGPDQEAARERAPVRQARERRPRPGVRGRVRADLRVPVALGERAAGDVLGRGIAEAAVRVAVHVSKPRSPGAFSFSESAPPAPLPLFRARLRAGSAAMPALRDRFAALAMSDFEKRARSRRYPDRTRVPWRPLRFDTRFRQFLRAPL